MWHPVIKICFYPPLKFFSVIVYLSYKSTTAYNWLGYTYLIARSYLHDVGQGIKAVHEQEESRMERSNEKQRGIRIFASSICRFFFLSLSWRPSSQFPDDQSCSSTVNSITISYGSLCLTIPWSWCSPYHRESRQSPGDHSFLCATHFHSLACSTRT